MVLSTSSNSSTAFPLPQSTLGLAFNLAALSLVGWLALKLYDVYLGPLSKYPGPKLWALSPYPRAHSMSQGRESSDIVAFHSKYGPVVRIGPHELSFASGADTWKDIYGFRKKGAPQPFKPKQFYGTPLNGIHGLISSDDAGHSRQRKIVSNSFSDKALKDQEPLLKKWATLMQKKLFDRADGKTPHDLVKWYNCTTFDVMGDLTFSEDLQMLEGGEYSPWVKTIFQSIKVGTMFRVVRWTSNSGAWFIDNFIFKTEAARKKQFEHQKYTDDRIDRRLKREPEHPDLWTKILEKGEDASEGGLSIGEHRSNASLFMIAGTETTATALSGTTYHLLRNPDTMKALTDEIRSAYDDFDDITLESLARQKYLNAVLQEGLRMYPPVPIALPRVTPPEGSTIREQFVPPGTRIGVNQLATYRMEENFKHANEFHPERWLGDEKFADDHLDALEPFSVGPRNCLGKVSSPQS